MYGYTVPNAGGIASGGTVLVPGGYKTFNSYYSPFTGTMTNQVYGQNLGQHGRTYGYSPLTGKSYRARPISLTTGQPHGGYNYSMVRRWGGT